MLRIILAVAVATFVWGTDQARADFSVCNKAHQTIFVALGAKKEDRWEAEGWWEIFPGDCALLVSGALPNRYYYVRGEGADGSTWDGDKYFCTMQTRFVLVDDKNCVAHNIDREGFIEVDTGDHRDFVHNLVP